MERITAGELEYLAMMFAEDIEKELGNKPGYRVINIGKLESSITQPFQQISGKDLYPTIISKAAILYYLCIKNHPFEDGNKRMGIFALILFLSKNGYSLETSNEKLFEITVYTASSKVEDIDVVKQRIEEFLQESITRDEVSS
jgi:death-on-curing protein